MSYRHEASVTRECKSKRRFSSVAEAEEEIRFLATYHGKELRSYQCIWCHGVHLTSDVSEV